MMTKLLGILAIVMTLLPISLNRHAFAESKFNFNDDYFEEEKSFLKVTNQEDPYESFNRKIFIFNEALDQYFAEPVAKAYRNKVPGILRKSIRNFLKNLSSPFVILNSIAQVDGKNSMASFSSFLINTTVGVGGVFDISKNKNIQYNNEDLGQTLGKYGVETGPFLLLPVVGPSNIRDFLAITIQKVSNPLSFNIFRIGGRRDLISREISLSIALTTGLDTREGLIEVMEDLRKNSFDPYATMRSAYIQRRKSLILNNIRSN